MGSENNAFSKNPSPRVNRVTCGEITVIVETRWRKSSLSIAAAVSPPPMTATRSALIRSAAARCQNWAIESTRGLPGRIDFSAWPGPVIITASAATSVSRVCNTQPVPCTPSRSTSPGITVSCTASATQRRYWLHRR